MLLLIYIPCVQVVSTNRAEEGSEEETKMKGKEQAVAAADVDQPDQKVRQVNPILVDHPTQLICIWIFICWHTKKKDIAG